MKKLIVFALSALFFISCTGPAGPTGPQGPEGPIEPGLYYVKIFQQGVYPTAYAGQVQSSLSSAQSNAYYTDSSNTINLGHITGSGYTYRAIIKFNLSSLPSTKVMVDKAELILKTNGLGTESGAADVKIHKVTSPWTVYQAGWEDSSTTSNWTAPGGDFTSNTITPNAANYDFGFNSTITIALDPAVVQGWMTSPATNYGVLLKSTDEAIDNACEIYSSGAAVASNRPMLKVWYYTTE